MFFYVCFVERYAKIRRVVAIPADSEAAVAGGVTRRQGLSVSAEFMRVGIPMGLWGAPLSDGFRCGSEEREGGAGVAVTTTGGRGMEFREAAEELQERTVSAPPQLVRVRASERRANERTNGSLVRLRVGPARLVRLRVGPARASDAAWSIEGRTHERASERVASDGAKPRIHRRASARTNERGLVRLRVTPARLVRLRVTPASARLVHLRGTPARLVRLRVTPASASDAARVRVRQATLL